MAVSLHMRARLPDAIVPSRVIAIDSLPLTPGGKLLRSALPDPPPLDAKVVGVGVGGRGLATQTERLVAAAWEAELSLPPESVGPSSNFFALGGTSTAAVRMLRRLAPDLAGRSWCTFAMGAAARGECIESRRGGCKLAVLARVDGAHRGLASCAIAPCGCARNVRFTPCCPLA